MAINIRILIICFFVLCACSGTEADSERSAVNKNHHVLIISVDGFPADLLWDPRVSVPNIRELALNGAWARTMIPSSPSVTWPNHTTIVTGVHPEKHGVLTNGRFVRSESGEITRENDLDRYDMSTYPTLYDLAYNEGLITGGVNWPVTRNTETMHFNLADAPGSVENATPQLISELLERGILEDATEPTLNRLGATARDHAWTTIASHIIETHQPNLMLFHLLNVDGIHHRYGKESWPGFIALAYADRLIGDLLETLDETGLRDQTSIFIVSDHGFVNVEKRVQPGVLLEEHGLGDRFQISGGPAAMLFSLNSDTKEEDIEKARTILEGAEGIHTIIQPEEYQAYGYPDPANNEFVGDLILGADDGYTFAGGTDGDYIVETGRISGSHGYLNNLPAMGALFVASGRGIRSGLELDKVDNRSVAPTAARLLGLTLETADGTVLDQILE